MNDITVSFVSVLLIALASAPYAMSDTTTVINAPNTSIPGCEINDECFIPHTVTIDVGDKVRWLNEDTVTHTITSGTPKDGADGIFDSGIVIPGVEFSHIFTESGQYPYYCVVHPWMVGMVVVQSVAEDNDDATNTNTPMEPQVAKFHDTANETPGMMTLSDGTGVMIETTKAVAGESMIINITFEDSEHTNYDIMANQGDTILLNVTGAHDHTGMGSYMTDHLISDEPIHVTVTFQGYGVDDITGPQNEKLVFVLSADVSEADTYDAYDTLDSGIITISGSAATSLDANILNIELGVSTVRDTAAQALNENSNQMNHIIDAMISVGIDVDELSTVRLSMHPEYRHQHDAVTGEYTQELAGYRVTNMISVDTDHLDMAADILDGAVSAGANRIDQVRFSVLPESETEARDGLIGAAVQQAKHKAALAVAPLGYDIVGVKSVTMVDSDVAIHDEHQFAYAEDSSAPLVFAGSKHLSVSVTVTFHIGR